MEIKEITVYTTSDGKVWNEKEVAELRESIFIQKKKVKKEEDELKTIINKCKHEYVKLKAKSDTGNYCKSDDCYWYEIECKVCGKRWDEDQHLSQYKVHGNNPKVEVIK